jgi:hypothetical protein
MTTPGTLIGSYTVERSLGVGGMSEAILARSPSGRLVVLKKPRGFDPELSARLRDEGRLGSRIFHKYLVETLDCFEHQGTPVLVLGYVEGPTLDELRKRAPLAPVSIARVGCQVAEALGAIHDALGDDGGPLGAIHRDVSARNIVVTDVNGRPTYHANLPLDSTLDEQTQLRRFVRELDRQNAPVSDSLVGQIHFGNTPRVKWLRIIPALQALSAFILLIAGIYIVRTRGNAERERVWAGMARESAHQLGTPLSSLAGWIELRRERPHVDGIVLTRQQSLDHRRIFQRRGVERDADLRRLLSENREATFVAGVPALRHHRESRLDTVSGFDDAVSVAIVEADARQQFARASDIVRIARDVR